MGNLKTATKYQHSISSTCHNHLCLFLAIWVQYNGLNHVLSYYANFSETNVPLLERRLSQIGIDIFLPKIDIEGKTACVLCGCPNLLSKRDTIMPHSEITQKQRRPDWKSFPVPSGTLL